MNSVMLNVGLSVSVWLTSGWVLLGWLRLRQRKVRPVQVMGLTGRRVTVWCSVVLVLCAVFWAVRISLTRPYSDDMFGVSVMVWLRLVSVLLQWFRNRA